MGTERPGSAQRRGITTEQRDRILGAIKQMLDGGIGAEPTEDEVTKRATGIAEQLQALDADDLWVLQHLADTLNGMIAPLAMRLLLVKMGAKR